MLRRNGRKRLARMVVFVVRVKYWFFVRGERDVGRVAGLPREGDC